MIAVGDVIECQVCGDTHEVIGHMSGMALMACPAVPRGEWVFTDDE